MKIALTIILSIFIISCAPEPSDDTDGRATQTKPSTGSDPVSFDESYLDGIWIEGFSSADIRCTNVQDPYHRGNSFEEYYEFDSVNKTYEKSIYFYSKQNCDDDDLRLKQVISYDYSAKNYTIVLSYNSETIKILDDIFVDTVNNNLEEMPFCLISLGEGAYWPYSHDDNPYVSVTGSPCSFSPFRTQVLKSIKLDVSNKSLTFVNGDQQFKLFKTEE